MSVEGEIKRLEQEVVDLRARVEREPGKAESLLEWIEDILERIANLRADAEAREDA